MNIVPLYGLIDKGKFIIHLQDDTLSSIYKLNKEYKIQKKTLENGTGGYKILIKNYKSKAPYVRIHYIIYCHEELKGN